MSTHGNQFKVVLLGDVAVGKTSLLNRYIYSTFSEVYMASIGMDFLSKNVTVGGVTIKLRVWDTAGMEKFKSLIPSYVRDCAAAVIVYDITAPDTFANVEKWANELKSAGKGRDGVVLALAANKFDLDSRRQVSDADGQSKADELNALYFPVSAARGTNVENLFSEIAAKLVPKDFALQPVNDSLHLREQTEKKGTCRC